MFFFLKRTKQTLLSDWSILGLFLPLVVLLLVVNNSSCRPIRRLPPEAAVDIASCLRSWSSLLRGSDHQCEGEKNSRKGEKKFTSGFVHPYTIRSLLGRWLDLDLSSPLGNTRESFLLPDSIRGPARHLFDAIPSRPAATKPTRRRGGHPMDD